MQEPSEDKLIRQVESLLSRGKATISRMAKYQQTAHDWGLYRLSTIISQWMRSVGATQTEMERYWKRNRNPHSLPARWTPCVVRRNGRGQVQIGFGAHARVGNAGRRRRSNPPASYTVYFWYPGVRTRQRKYVRASSVEEAKAKIRELYPHATITTASTQRRRRRNPSPGGPIKYGGVHTRRGIQEWYETASGDAGVRARQLRKLGYRVYSSAMGPQVTNVGVVKMTLVDIEPGTSGDTNLDNVPRVREERI